MICGVCFTLSAWLRDITRQTTCFGGQGEGEGDFDWVGLFKWGEVWGHILPSNEHRTEHARPSTGDFRKNAVFCCSSENLHGRRFDRVQQTPREMP